MIGGGIGKPSNSSSVGPMSASTPCGRGFTARQLVAHQHALDVVGGVRGLHGAGVGIEHLLGVPVIGRDDDDAAAGARRLDHPADALVGDRRPP